MVRELKVWRNELISEIKRLNNQSSSLDIQSYNSVMTLIQEKELTLNKVNKILTNVN
jgi:sRNA-binding carbon storage regulator CsrA